MSFVQLKDKDNNPIYPITTIKDIKYKGIDHKDTFMEDIYNKLNSMSEKIKELTDKIDSLEQIIEDLQGDNETPDNSECQEDEPMENNCDQEQ